MLNKILHILEIQSTEYFEPGAAYFATFMNLPVAA